MIRCKSAIYLKIDFVLNRLQFEEPIAKYKLNNSRELKEQEETAWQGQEWRLGKTKRNHKQTIKMTVWWGWLLGQAKEQA